MDEIPPLPGAYVVQFYLTTTQELEVGKLGNFQLPRGVYYYMGSARGPGGLRARITRHLVRTSSRPHWHIDWLSRVAVPQAVYYLHIPADHLLAETNDSILAIECTWTQALMALQGAAMPAPGFGSSDCQSRCNAHLVAFARVNNPINEPIAISRHIAKAINIKIDHIEYNQIHKISE